MASRSPGPSQLWWPYSWTPGSVAGQSSLPPSHRHDVVLHGNSDVPGRAALHHRLGNCLRPARWRVSEERGHDLALTGLRWLLTVVCLLLEEPRLTLLNLHATRPLSTGVEASAANPNPSIESSPSDSVPDIQAPRKPRARKRNNRVLAFDKFGRSPLERVINKK